MIQEKNAPAVVQTIDPDTRWEEGIDHDPRSEEIVRWIADYDFRFCDDYFCWKVGGDGDNGETLMYELDEYFAAKDKGPATDKPKIAKFRSDYDPDTILTISMTDDADVVIDIFGKGECRITTSGGQLLGERGVKVIKAFREIIEALGYFGEERNG